MLARAGLSRLGRLDAITETLDPLQVLPAPAQGALAVECRTSDARTRELLGRLEDAVTRACVVAERSTLAALEAGCSAPVAAYAEIAEGDDRPRAVPPRLGHRDRRQRRRPRLGDRPRRRRRRARAARWPPNCSTAARPSSWRSADDRPSTPRPPQQTALRARIRSTR